MKKSLLVSLAALLLANLTYAGIMLGYTPEMCAEDVAALAGENGGAYCFPLDQNGAEVIVGDAAWTNCALGTYNYGNSYGYIVLFNGGTAIDLLLMDEAGDCPVDGLDAMAQAFSPGMRWGVSDEVQSIESFLQWLDSGGTPVLQADDMQLWDGKVCLQIVPVPCGGDVRQVLAVWSATYGVPGGVIAPRVAAMMESPELAAKVMGGGAPETGGQAMSESGAEDEEDEDACDVPSDDDVDALFGVLGGDDDDALFGGPDDDGGSSFDGLI